MTGLPEFQEAIEAVRSERGFTTDPVQVLCLLIEEVGEVAAEIKKTWSDNYPALVIDDLRDELADVFVLLSALASSFDVDLHDAVRAKFFGSDADRDWTTAMPTKPKVLLAPDDA